jgi:GntR family transcriptional regulator
MILFRLTFEPGISVYEQVVYAAKKVLVSGQMRPGDAFPSVRALSKALKISVLRFKRNDAIGCDSTSVNI